MVDDVAERRIHLGLSPSDPVASGRIRELLGGAGRPEDVGVEELGVLVEQRDAVPFGIERDKDRSNRGTLVIIERVQRA